MKTIRDILITTILLAILGPSALAISLPVAEDTFNTSRGVLSAANGKAGTLPLNTNQAALVKFDLSSLPVAFTPSNIASARLKIYIVSARTPGDLVATLIRSDWTEAVVTNTPIPASDTNVVGIVPAAKVLAKHFVTIDVTAAVVAALDGSGPNFGFLLQDTTGHTAVASKEGPGLGPAVELEIDANLALNGSGGWNFPGAVDIGGDLTLSGLLRQGTETGTAEPAGRGIIVRRLQSTNASLGTVVARTDTMTLERDGTASGWRIINTANPGNATIVATGVDANGSALSKTTILGPNPYPAWTNILFSDAQFPVYFHCVFGNAFDVDHMTEVILFRSPNNGGTNWIGRVISSYNQ